MGEKVRGSHCLLISNSKEWCLAQNPWSEPLYHAAHYCASSQNRQILLRSWKAVAIFLIPILIPDLTCCLNQRRLWNVQNSLVTLRALCCFWGNWSRGVVLGPVSTQQHWSVRSWLSLLGQFEVFVEGKGILPRTRFSHKETSSAAKDPPQHTKSSKVMKKYK